MAVPRRIRVPQAVARVRPRLAGDDRLVALLRGGDLTAFEILYERHVRELLSYCNWILGSRQDAEDAVQSTFASAYRALIADERPVDVRPWLFAIARNAALSIVRSRRPTVEYDESAPGGGDPVAQAEQREGVRQVVTTMLELPEHQRTALALAELSGLSHGEIGAVLGVAPETVKSYIFQARSNLISERIARSTDCNEIRQELAGARGPALLKSRLRRHVRSCEGCREYARELSRQRGQLGALLPLVPTLELRRRVLDAASGDAFSAGISVGGGGVAASLAGAGAELAGGGVKALVAKLLIGAVAIGAGTGAGTAVLAASASPERHAAHALRATGTRPRANVVVSTGGVVLRAGRGEVPSARGTLPERRSPTGPTILGMHAGRYQGIGRDGAEVAAAPARGKGGEAHGNSAQPHGNGSAPGKSGEAHGKSGEAHGKSGEARAKSDVAHGQSEAAHGNVHALGKSTQAHGNGVGHDNAPAPGKSVAAHGAPASRPSQSHAPGSAQAATPSTSVDAVGANGNGNGANNPPPKPSETAAEGTTAATAGGAGGNGVGAAHGQGEPARPALEAHETHEANPHKP